MHNCTSSTYLGGRIIIVDNIINAKQYGEQPQRPIAKQEFLWIKIPVDLLWFLCNSAGFPSRRLDFLI